jgi:hypothetical protein
MKKMIVLTSILLSSLTFAKDNCIVEISSSEADYKFGISARSSCTDGQNIQFESTAYKISDYKLDLKKHMSEKGYTFKTTTSYKDNYGKMISHLIFEKNLLLDKSLKNLEDMNKQSSEVCIKPSCIVEVYSAEADTKFGLTARSSCSDGKVIKYESDTYNLVQFNSGFVQHMSTLGYEPTGLSSYKDIIGRTFFEFTFN